MPFRSKEPRCEFKYRARTRALYIAELIDAYRVIPRALLVAYGLLVYIVVDWYMLLPDPTTQQAAIATTVTGTVAAVIGLYQRGGRSWGAPDKIEPSLPIGPIQTVTTTEIGSQGKYTDREHIE